MFKPAAVFRFEQIHIDVARNSTDDFNPFHDPCRWRSIRGNPFGAPIALGFQLESLVDYLVTLGREERSELALADGRHLHFSNHEFVFAGVLRAGEPFRVDIRSTLDQTALGGGLSNRVMVRKASGDAVLFGMQSISAVPRFLADVGLPGLGVLDRAPDRTFVGNGRFFLKRKFMNTSNAKNFALAALADQRYYIDELAERVHFPPMFTASLLSCALLEKARLENVDFEANPRVYTTHQISVDRRLQTALRSNDRLHMLVEGPSRAEVKKGLGRSAVAQDAYTCLGVVGADQVLFRAVVRTAPMQAILATG
jgi:hypothetical protein